ncbi:hypothetical protein Syun_029520 [Stephania yunnanensis]|uniref:Uncharacterized protein n=1 Tax=Stephania yunnanensis TaxID=152371 RepID=A0AAP0E5S3_9MAGN
MWKGPVRNSPLHCHPYRPKTVEILIPKRREKMAAITLSLSSSSPSPNLITSTQNPNPNSPIISHRLSFYFKSQSPLNLSTPNRNPLRRLALQSLSPRCYYNGGFYGGGGDGSGSHDRAEDQRVRFPRPSEIPWTKDLCNSVNLIGVVGAAVQIKHLASGKAVAWTRIGVKKSAADTIWINLTFWEELAHVASQHLEKGHRIYVSGRLESNTVEGDDEKSQTYYKVVVQQLNFIERKFSPIALYDHEKNSLGIDGRVGNNAVKRNVGSSSSQELWQAFFANPMDWWDNRKNKRSSKYPDFKHKHTGESLWVEGKYNPSWVKSQLAILDSRMESLHVNEDSTHVSYVSGDDAAIF